MQQLARGLLGDEQVLGEASTALQQGQGIRLLKQVSSHARQLDATFSSAATVEQAALVIEAAAQPSHADPALLPGMWGAAADMGVYQDMDR